MSRSRVHYVVVRLVFDRPILRRDAVYEAQQNIHGEMYTAGSWRDSEDHYPESFKVKGIKSHAVKR